MKVFALQLPVSLGNVEKNRSDFIDKIKAVSDDSPSIFVLPEMWLTGFDYKNLVRHSELTEDICTELASILKENDLVISSLPEKNGKKVFNTIYAVTKDGVAAKYRKNLLFSPTRENEYIDSGDNIIVFEHFGVKIGLHLCYEIRFPELFRMSAFLDADVFLVPAVWPGNKKAHWQTLTRARAIENQCYLVGANCSVMHTTKQDMPCGFSVAFDPWGEPLFNESEESGVFVCEINPEKVKEIRNSIPSFYDAKDTFQIHKISK